MLDAMALEGESEARGRVLDPDKPVATFVRPESFRFLRSLHISGQNRSPRFSMTDLTSACVSLAFKIEDAAGLVIREARSVIAREGRVERLRCDLWPQQFDVLRDLQRSRENRSPNPHCDLGDLTTACIAMARSVQDAPVRILHEARLNLAGRIGVEAGRGRVS